MKIAVYTIALNEEKHVARWYESAKEADLLLIADTGSTDKTRFIAKSLGITVHEISVVPWRFDVARNASLALIPEDFDICIQLDMDETLEEGWRGKVEEAFSSGNNWPIYKHVSSRSENGKPRTYQHYFKIHPRQGFIWKYPIHEVLVSQPGVEFKREVIDLEVNHVQDHSKSRKSYLDLLEMAVKEDSNDWRMRHYLNREYWYNKDWNKVLSSAYEAMQISEGWDVERASTCVWASEAAHFLNLKKLSIEWAERATSEAPNFYEAWHWRAHIAHLRGDWASCREYSFKILTLSRQDHHLVKTEVWEWWGYDLIALSSHNLGKNRDAVYYGLKAFFNAPLIERLKSNLFFYQQAYEKENVEQQKNWPLVTWAIIAKDAEDSLPLYFQTLLTQTYPKSSISLFVRTNDSKDSTLELLQNFLSNFRELFASVILDDTSINAKIKEFSLHEWNSTRFKIMSDIRQESLNVAIQNKSEFYFCSDVDNFIVEDTLESLVSLDLKVVAPLLRCVIPDKWPPSQAENFYYSNFHDDVDKEYWFQDTNRYREIMEGKLQGIFEVPLVHCTYLIRNDVFESINYHEIPENWEYKNFSISLSRAQIPQHIDARKTYGFLTLSNDIGSCEIALEALPRETDTFLANLNFKESNFSEVDKKAIFDEIYSLEKWGFQSGSGSDPEVAKVWIDTVNRILGLPSINSDLGSYER
jgi:glycosyltransferase involved in cell wall biosynthesis